MRKQTASLLFFLLLSSVECQAFNGMNCHKILFRTMDKGPLGIRLSSGSSSSSSSVTSSTGACSMFGLKEQREEFLVANQDAVMRESARGSGEYVESLTRLSGCGGETARKSFGAMLQSRFNAIYFTGEKAASVEEVTRRIDSEITASPELKIACLIDG